jgi:hypothetical protein
MAMRLHPGQRIDLESPALDAAEAGQWIAVACRCGHSSTMGPHTYGYATGRLRDLARLMRCQQCGSRGAVRMWLLER